MVVALSPLDVRDYTSQSYSPPRVDTHSDITSVATTVAIVNGDRQMRLAFRRQLDTGKHICAFSFITNAISTQVIKKTMSFHVDWLGSCGLSGRTHLCRTTSRTVVLRTLNCALVLSGTRPLRLARLPAPRRPALLLSRLPAPQ